VCLCACVWFAQAAKRKYKEVKLNDRMPQQTIKYHKVRRVLASRGGLPVGCSM